MVRLYRALHYWVLPGAISFGFLGVSLGDVSSFLKGPEFRQFVAQVVTQLAVGVSDAIVDTFVLATFGAFQ